MFLYLANWLGRRILPINTFFCCYPLLSRYNTHKLDSRSHECLFLGYSTSHKGYKWISLTLFIFPSIPYINNQPPHQANFSYSSSSQSLQNNQVATTVDTTFKSNFDIVLQSTSIVASLQSLDTMHTSLLIVDNNTAHSPNTTDLSSSYTSSFSLSPSWPLIF